MVSRGLENLDAVRKLFDAMGRGDLGAIRQLLADDVALIIPGTFRLAGTFAGPDGFLQGFGQLIEASLGTLQVQLVSTAVNGLDGDQVIATYHATGAVRNEPIDEDIACLVTLTDGRITQMIDFYGDPVTVARQWD